MLTVPYQFSKIDDKIFEFNSALYNCCMGRTENLFYCDINYLYEYKFCPKRFELTHGERERLSGYLFNTVQHINCLRDTYESEPKNLFHKNIENVAGGRNLIYIDTHVDFPLCLPEDSKV